MRNKVQRLAIRNDGGILKSDICRNFCPPPPSSITAIINVTKLMIKKVMIQQLEDERWLKN